MSLIIETKTQPINQQNAPTNPTANSSIPLALGHIEFNIFFDGTWNSKKNSDFYNDPENLKKDDFKDPKAQKKKYNLGISFARAPTGVDRMHRASKDKDPYIIPLYVDGSGTESWEDHQNKPSKDNALGAALGWFSTGVNGKLDKMYKQIKDKIDELMNDGQQPISSIIFNVYGFSRGAATARMFCNRVIKVKKIPLEKEYVLDKREYLDLSPYSVTLKMVGIFDTVSSIGVNHTDDVESNGQDLDFGQCFATGKIIHILAGHEFRQKFNVTSIKKSVLDGNGFELVMPGCHTDIGDGLGTETRYNSKEKDVNKQWEVTARNENKTILQKYRIYDDEPDDVLFPSIHPLPVGRSEFKARKENNNANFGEVLKYLVEKGWFKDEDDDPQIKIEKGKVFEMLNVCRDQISSDYPKIPTFIMLEFVKKFGAYHFNDNYFEQYSIATTCDENLLTMYNNLSTQAFELLTKNEARQEQRYVDTVIYDGMQDIKHTFAERNIDMPYIDIKGNEDLRKLMYNKYLHWCSEMKRGVGDLTFTQVNIAHIDIRTNRFYREVVEG